MNDLHLYDVLKSPINSEKSIIAGDKYNTIVFKVKKDASSNEIRQAVELLFKVEVDSVNTLNVKGKKKRFGRTLGQKSDWKKAYVKLKAGFDINFATP